MSPHLLALMSLPLMLIGCGDKEGSAAGDPTGDSGGASASCAWTATEVDHSADCPDGDCPITEDLTLACADEGFGAHGVRVASDGSVAYAVVPTAVETLPWSVDGGSATWLGDPATGLSGSPVLALAEDGVLNLVDATDGISLHARAGDAWSTYAVGSGSEVLGLEYGADGALWVWSGDGTDFALRVGAEDSWLAETAAVPADSDYEQFAVGPGDERISTALVYNGNGWTPTHLIDSVEGVLGDQEVADTPLPMRVASQATGLSSEELLVFGKQYTNHILVLWTPSGVVGRSEVLGTSVLVRKCEAQAVENCPEVCFEDDDGVAPGAFSLTRTSDGSVWIAYAYVTYDETWNFELVDDGAGGEVCEGGRSEDLSTAELYLVRVPTDGTVQRTAFSVEIEPPASDLLAESSSSVRSLDLRAQGDHLALGLVTQRGDEDPVVRVLSVDTSLAE